MKFIAHLSEKKRMQDQGKFSPAQTGESFLSVSPVTGLERQSLLFFNVGRAVVLHLNHVPHHQWFLMYFLIFLALSNVIALLPHLKKKKFYISNLSPLKINCH